MGGLFGGGSAPAPDTSKQEALQEKQEERSALAKKERAEHIRNLDL